MDIMSFFKKNETAAAQFAADRRGFLRGGLAAAAAIGFWIPSLPEMALANTAQARSVSLMNQHTGEKFRGEYWHDGRYLPDAFGEIKTLMRDHRTGERFPIDPRLMDILYVLHHRLNTPSAFNVISGYRSPKTNAMLRKNTEGVARNSLHMSGQAVDLRVPGIRLASVRNAAQALQSGGVGFYPKSNFVHLDTGRVRAW